VVLTAGVASAALELGSPDAAPEGVALAEATDDVDGDAAPEARAHRYSREVLPESWIFAARSTPK
jgi:hypothetical protein